MEPLPNEDVFLPKDQTYVVGLTVKSGESNPSLQIYFASITEAIISMFHPSMQNFLASGKEASERGDTSFDDSLEIYLNVFFVKEQVVVKRPQNMGSNRENLRVQNLINNPKTNIFRERDELQNAIQHDCHLEGTPSFLIDVPVYFDLTAIKTNFGRILHMMDARTEAYKAMDKYLPDFLEVAKDINGRLNGLVFCDLDLLIHVESYILNKDALVDVIRKYMNENYGLIGDTFDSTEVSRLGYMTLAQIISYVRSTLQGDKDSYLTKVNIKAIETSTGLDLSPKSIVPSLSVVTSKSRPTVGPFGDPNEPMGIDAFQNIPYDVLRLIGLNMDLESINRACRTSQIFNNTFCSYGPNNENFARAELFWLEKTRRDFGEEAINKHELIEDEMSRGINTMVIRPRRTFLEYYRSIVGAGLSDRLSVITRGLTTLQLLQLWCLLDTIKIVRNNEGVQEITRLIPDIPYEFVPAGRQRPAQTAHTGLTPIVDLLEQVGGRSRTALRKYLDGTRTDAGGEPPVLDLISASRREPIQNASRLAAINFMGPRTNNPYGANTLAGFRLEERRPQIIDWLRPFIELLNNNDYLIYVPSHIIRDILMELSAGGSVSIIYLLHELVEDKTKQIRTISRKNTVGPSTITPIYSLDDRSRLIVKRLLVKLFNMSDRDKEPGPKQPYGPFAQPLAPTQGELDNPFDPRNQQAQLDVLPQPQQFQPGVNPFGQPPQ